MIKMVFRNICNVTLGITVQGRGFKGMVARIACRKAETQRKLLWCSKHNSVSRTFWEAPPAPKRKLRHPKTHLRTRRAPFNHQALPVTFPGNQGVQSHFTGWTSINFKWTGALAPRPFPNLSCLRVSNSLLISSLNIFLISSCLSVFAAAQSIKANQSHPSHNQRVHSQQPRPLQPTSCQVKSCCLRPSPLLIPASSSKPSPVPDVPSLKPSKSTKETHAKIRVKKKRDAKRRLSLFNAEIKSGQRDAHEPSSCWGGYTSQIQPWRCSSFAEHFCLTQRRWFQENLLSWARWLLLSLQVF